MPTLPDVMTASPTMPIATATSSKAQAEFKWPFQGHIHSLEARARRAEAMNAVTKFAIMIPILIAVVFRVMQKCEVKG